VTRDGMRLSTALRGRVVRRVLLALSRFGPRVTRVSVRLAEPANALGGVDQRCPMRAWLHDSDGIRAEAINGGFEAAVTRAAGQLAKRVDLSQDGGARARVDAPPGARRRPAASRRRATP
jgi:hypothetical protein